MTKHDTAQLQVKDENGNLGKSVRVLKLGASEMYRIASTQQQAPGAELMVRLMPDATEVQTALDVRSSGYCCFAGGPSWPQKSADVAVAQLYAEAGISASSFIGVPIFQAAGLSIRTEQVWQGAL